MRCLLGVTLFCIAFAGPAFAGAPASPLVGISVTECSPSPCTPNQPVNFGETINNQTPTITITITSSFNCAGQLALTALGAPGAPPEVGIVTSPGLFTIDLSNGNSVTTLPITLGVLPNGTNAFKISASCNGAINGQFAFGVFEFSIR
jgi:hypothetical protein